MITIILLILLLLDLICVGREAFAAATVLTLATLGGIWIFSHNPFLWVINNPAIVAYSAAAYLVLGFVYSILKYKRHLSKSKVEYIKNYGAEKWESGKCHFSPAKMQADIIGWIVWWPLSLVGYFVSDFLFDLVNKFWGVIKGRFEGIYNKA